MSAPSAIATLQTPPAPGGIAVIHVGGADAETILKKLTPELRTPPETGRLKLTHLIGAAGPIDQGLIARTPDGWELNLHGGPMVVRHALDELQRLGCEIGDPLPDLPATCMELSNPAIGRELQEALPAAASPLVLRVLANQWSAGLSRLAHETLQHPTLDAAEKLAGAADAFHQVRRLLTPPEVVLAGPPNAGKSTLFNALVGRQVGIVHDRAGTTRDWLREKALLNGRPIWLTDTAGLWSPECPLDALAVQRAHQRIAAAELVLFLSPDEPFAPPVESQARACLHVRTKADLPPAPREHELAISAQTDTGLEKLKTAILNALGLDTIDPDAPAAFTQRQHDLLIQATEELKNGNKPTAKEKLKMLLGN